MYGIKAGTYFWYVCIWGHRPSRAHIHHRTKDRAKGCGSQSIQQCRKCSIQQQYRSSATLPVQRLNKNLQVHSKGPARVLGPICFVSKIVVKNAVVQNVVCCSYVDKCCKLFRCVGCFDKVAWLICCRWICSKSPRTGPKCNCCR